MSTTTASKRERKAQRGKSTLVLSSHRSPAGLAIFFLVSFQVVFWFASCFSGFFPGCFLVCQLFFRFPARSFPGFLPLVFCFYPVWELSSFVTVLVCS